MKTKTTYAKLASNKAVTTRFQNIWMPLLFITFMTVLYGEFINTNQVMQPDPSQRYSFYGVKF